MMKIMQCSLKYGSYRTVNTFLLGYKNQSVNAVWGNNSCLFRDPHKTLRYTVWTECGIVER